MTGFIHRRAKAIVVGGSLLGLLSVAWVTNLAVAQSVVPSGLKPPVKQNAYERANDRGIWDRNWTDAPSGLYWELPDSGKSENKSGNKPETPKFIQPTFQELNAKFYQVEQAELHRVISSADDPTYAALMNTEPLADARGRKLVPGMYSVALRQGNGEPVANLEALMAYEAEQAAMASEALQRAQIEKAQFNPALPVDGKLVYPRNDLTWQTQSNPFSLSNPRLITASMIAPKVIGNGGQATPMAGGGPLVLVVKQQGVVKGIFPVVGQQPYARTRHDRKAKPAFAQVATINDQPMIALYVGKTVYLASANPDLPTVIYPTVSGPRYDY